MSADWVLVGLVSSGGALPRAGFWWVLVGSGGVLSADWVLVGSGGALSAGVVRALPIRTH